MAKAPVSVGILGVTGEVGKQVLRHLCLKGNEHVKQVTMFTRREVKLTDLFSENKAKEIQAYFDSAVGQQIIDFEKIDEISFKGLDVLISAVGTTMQKAKSVEQFRKVDFDYVHNAASKAKQDGVKTFVLCSAMGANDKSMLNYPRIKGELEVAIKALRFDHCGIFRPGLLLCSRKESRPMEWLAQSLTGPLDFMHFGSIPTTMVGAAMTNYAVVSAGEEVTEPVVNEYNNREISQLAALDDAGVKKALTPVTTVTSETTQTDSPEGSKPVREAVETQGVENEVTAKKVDI